MKTILTSISVAFILLLAGVGGLSAQPIPLMRGTQWRYIISDHPRDTARVTIVGDTLATVACNRESALCTAWMDDAGSYYVIMPRGVMIATRPAAGARGLQPVLFIPKGSDAGPACPAFARNGTATVVTPAGTFENCLVYDDKRVARIYVKPGIGIVKEEQYAEPTEKGGAGERAIARTRMLVGYTLPAAGGAERR